jgi:hypothetical protein
MHDDKVEKLSLSLQCGYPTNLGGVPNFHIHPKPILSFEAYHFSLKEIKICNVTKGFWHFFEVILLICTIGIWTMSLTSSHEVKLVF